MVHCKGICFHPRCRRPVDCRPNSASRRGSRYRTAPNSLTAAPSSDMVAFFHVVWQLVRRQPLRHRTCTSLGLPPGRSSLPAMWRSPVMCSTARRYASICTGYCSIFSSGSVSVLQLSLLQSTMRTRRRCGRAGRSTPRAPRRRTGCRRTPPASAPAITSAPTTWFVSAKPAASR